LPRGLGSGRVLSQLGDSQEALDALRFSPLSSTLDDVLTE